MTETPLQYRNRLLSYVEGKNPLERLEKTSEELKRLFEKRSADQWSRRMDGAWNPAQILAHLAEGELVLSYRLRMVARANGCEIQAYDQNVWVADSNYLIQNSAEALRLFLILREANLLFLKALPESKWDYYGNHSERGKETIRDMIALLAGHDLNHLRQLDQRLQ